MCCTLWWNHLLNKHAYILVSYKSCIVVWWLKFLHYYHNSHRICFTGCSIRVVNALLEYFSLDTKFLAKLSSWFPSCSNKICTSILLCMLSIALYITSSLFFWCIKSKEVKESAREGQVPLTPFQTHLCLSKSFYCTVLLCSCSNFLAIMT